MNTGLKQFTKQLKHTIGNATTSINLFKNDSNMHIMLPLIATSGLNSFETSLIFNYQDKDKTGIFGKGFKLNHYASIAENGNELICRNADGSTDYYTFNEYHSETQMKPVRVDESTESFELYRVELHDRAGNKIVYSSSSANDYPRKIVSTRKLANSSNCETINLNFTASTKTINNGMGDEIAFEPNSSGRIGTVTYKYNNVVLEKVAIQYQDDRIVSVEYKTQYNETVGKIEIQYFEDEIIIVDAITGYRSRFIINSGKVEAIIDGFGDNMASSHTSDIVYECNKTRVIAWDGTFVEYFFDSDGFPLYQINSEGYAVEMEYDKETKQLLAQSNPILINGPQYDYCGDCNPIDFELNNVTQTAVPLINITAEQQRWVSLLGGSVNRFTHAGSGTGTVRFSIPIDCIATDNVTAVLFAKQKTDYSESNNVRLDLFLGDSDIDYLKKPVVDDNYELVLLGAHCTRTATEATFMFTLKGDVSFEIGGIRLYKQDFGSFYEYDENTNNLTLMSRCGENAKISYGSSNKISKMTGFDSTIFNFEYNDQGYPLKSTSAYGVEIVNDYNAQHPSLLEKQTLYNEAHTQKIETKKEYTEDGRHVKKEYDEFGVCLLEKQYDMYGQLDSATNALGAISLFEYDKGLVSLTALRNDSETFACAQYSYNDKRQLTGIYLSNGSTYKFEYDYRGALTNIKLNDVTVFVYEYDNEGHILRQKFGVSGDAYEFEYGIKNLVDKVYYVTASGQKSLKFQYVYDQYNRLSCIKDTADQVITAYEYDDAGNIKKIESDNITTSYCYDNLGNVNSILREGQTGAIHEAFSGLSRSQSTHPEKLEDKFQRDGYFTTFSSNDAKIKYKNYELSPNQSSHTYGKDGTLPYLVLNQSKKLSYTMTNHSLGDLENGGVMFWFKPKSNDPQYLFSVKGSYRGDYITAHIDQGYVEVDLIGNDSLYSACITDSKIKLNEWNFFALNYAFRADEGTSPCCEVRVTLNGESDSFKTYGSLFDVNVATPTYHIGQNPNGNSTSEYFNGDIACLYIGPRHYISDSTLSEFKNITNDFIESCQFISTESKTLDASETISLALSPSIVNSFDICPLNNNVSSIKGLRPTKYKRRIGVTEDKDKSFNFNFETLRYAYVADGSDLAYKFGQNNSGTIMMRVFTKETYNKQYLFEGIDANGLSLALYRDENNRLVVDHVGNRFLSDLIMSNNEWHTVGLSFDKNVVQDSAEEVCADEIRVFLDGQTFSVLAPFGFTDIEFSIGRRHDVETISSMLGSIEDCGAFNGQIEMLCVNNAFNTIDKLNALMSQINPITKINEFDEFGRLKHSVVKNSDDVVMQVKTTYATRAEDTSYTSQQISSEEFDFPTGGYTRSYSYDIMGNVTSVSDTANGSHTYEYDQRGFLVRDDSTTFAYDSNGNITRKGSTTFEYDGTIKDKLVKVGNKTIAYPRADSLMPSSYDNKMFTFEGRRLVGIDIANTSGTQQYKYVYDDQGLRIKKTLVGGNTINYAYNGTKLVSEIAPSYRLDFLYDENGQLYGFIKDGTTKYFYVRDFLQNILGIVDTTGNYVVKYSYTAYGECSVTYDTIGLASLNPFRYKGYYFDTESGMYYCHTRFYVPEWCRWLNADSPSYLKADSHFGMNMFAYCCNDPINLLDEDGCISKFWKRFLVIVAAIVVVAAVVAVTVASGGLAGPVLAGAAIGFGTGVVTSVATQYATTGDCDWGQAITDGAISMAFGAFGGSAIGAGGMAISNGLLGVGSSIANDWIDGKEINVWNALASGIVSGLVGFASGGGAQHGLTGPRSAALNKRAQIEKRYSEGGYRTQHNYEFGKQSNAARINRATIVLKNRSYQNLLRDFISSLEINTYQSILFS